MSPLMEIDPLLEHYWKIVQTEVSKKDFTIALGCEYALKEFIRDGVARLRTESIDDISQRDVENAETVLKKFVNEMIEWSLLNGTTELHEGSFFSIKDKLCPCRPFC